jgi:hypothetical protein
MHAGWGSLEKKAEEVFLRVFADGKKYAKESRTPGKDGSYFFAMTIKPALVKYQIELGTRTGGAETVLHQAGDIVCGDAYIIDGQSNALATDIREESLRVTNEWVRSYGRAQFFKGGKGRTSGVSRYGKRIRNTWRNWDGGAWSWPIDWRRARKFQYSSSMEHAVEPGWTSTSVTTRIQQISIRFTVACSGG